MLDERELLADSIGQLNAVVATALDDRTDLRTTQIFEVLRIGADEVLLVAHVHSRSSVGWGLVGLIPDSGDVGHADLDLW